MENIIVTDSDKLDSIKKRMAQSGAEKLHILSDFDRTLTTAFIDGEYVPSSVSALRDSKSLSPDFISKSQELYNKYHPIEMDPKIALEEKKAIMHEWWSTFFELMVKSGFNKKHIEEVINCGKIRFRKGCDEFLGLLNENDVPLVIISSSGLGGDSISMFLEGQGTFYDNIHIISNSFEWDNDGNALSVREPIIHGMGKHDIMVKDFPAFDTIKDRKNVILLGDNLGDVGMIEGFDYDNLIKIGFLEENNEENIESYKQNYDIVLLNDSPMDYINGLLKDILR